MKGWLRTLGLTALLAGHVLANEVELVSDLHSSHCEPCPSGMLTSHSKKSDDAQRQRCSGMYSRKAWGGSVDPFILVKFSKVNNVKGDPKASLVIFEWNDEGLIGEYRNPGDKVQLVISKFPASSPFELMKYSRSRKLSATRQTSTLSFARKTKSAPSYYRRTQAKSPGTPSTP